MTPLIAINIAIWLLMLLLIAFTKWDYGVIAIGIMMLLVLTGCLDADTALSKFADTNVIMMATMMIVAKGFGKTRLVGNIASLLFKVSGTFEQLIDYDKTPRDQALAQARAQAVELAVAAGAIRETVEIIDAEDVPLQYYPGNTARVKIKAAGDLA